VKASSLYIKYFIIESANGNSVGMYRLKVLDEDVSRRNLKDFDGVSFLRPIKFQSET
jgi:hypothetical protein